MAAPPNQIHLQKDRFDNRRSGFELLEERGMETLNTADPNFEMATNILHRLAKSFNK